MTSATLKSRSERGRGAREVGTRNAEVGSRDQTSAFPLPTSHFAFTLLEVLLSMTVLALLIGAVSLGVAGGTRTRYLNEGADRFETALRMARAEAAGRGRSMRMTFTERGECAVEWEPGPLEEPGVFMPYKGSMWATTLPNDLVRVVRCKVNGLDAYRPPDAAVATSNMSDKDEAVLDPITFRPDGSCDSAIVELRSTDERDGRGAIVDVDGVNAAFTTRILTPSELEERREAK